MKTYWTIIIICLFGMAVVVKAENLNVYEAIAKRAAIKTSTNHIATITIESIKPYREAIKKLEAISNDTVISGQVKFWANLEISSLIVKIQEIVKNKKGLMWNDICIVCGTIKE